jgi:isocitrate dehydrogenase
MKLKIVSELNDAQGVKVDIGGYYKLDEAKNSSSHEAKQNIQ